MSTNITVNPSGTRTVMTCSEGERATTVPLYSRPAFLLIALIATQQQQHCCFALFPCVIILSLPDAAKLRLIVPIYLIIA